MVVCYVVISVGLLLAFATVIRPLWQPLLQSYRDQFKGALLPVLSVVSATLIFGVVCTVITLGVINQ